MKEGPSAFLVTMLCLGIAILYIPMLVLIAYSFNASALVSVWGGFSTAWYAALLHNDQIIDAAWLSLKIGVAASTLAVMLGTLAASALVRFKAFRGRLLLQAVRQNFPCTRKIPRPQGYGRGQFHVPGR